MAIGPEDAGIPALAYLVIGMAAYLSWASVVGLRYAWAHTFGWVLNQLADLLKFKVLGHGFDWGGPVRAINDTVLNGLAHQAESFQASAGYFFHGAAQLTEWAVQATEDLAAQTLHFGHWITHVHLPRYARWAITALVPPLLAWQVAKYVTKHVLPTVVHIAGEAAHGAKVFAGALAGELSHDLHRAEKLLRALEGQLAAVAGHLPHVHAPSFPTPWKLWRGFTRKAARLERRMARLEALLGVTAFAAMMAKVLGLGSSRCLRSGNLGKLSRWLCGLDSSLIDLLALGAFEAMVVSDLCAFSSAIVKATQVAEPALMGFVDVEDALLGCSSASFPPGVGTPALDLGSAPLVVNL